MDIELESVDILERLRAIAKDSLMDATVRVEGLTEEGNKTYFLTINSLEVGTFAYLKFTSKNVNNMLVLSRILGPGDGKCKVQIRLMNSARNVYKVRILSVDSLAAHTAAYVLVREKAKPPVPKTNLGQLLKEKLEARPLETAGFRRHNFGERGATDFPYPYDAQKYAITGQNLCQEIILPTESYKVSHTEIPSTLSKENSMSNTLIKLADVNLQQELAQVGLTQNAGLKAALEAEIKARADNANKEAAKEIMQVLDSADRNIETNVVVIRQARATEKMAKERIELIKRAKAYGLATSNFIPLAMLIGTMTSFDLTQEQRKLAEIPTDFKVEDVKPEAAAQ